MPESHSAPSISPDDTLYHSVPQAPVASNPIPHSTSTDLDLNVEEPDDEPLAFSSAPIGARIQWIHFMLGCAVLLPWNALITATPYFLSRLAGSPLRASFSSYLSTSFTATNFGFLAYATITSKRASSSRRIFLATLWLAFLVLLLTISTYVHVSPGLFFAFVILNGLAQAGAGSYLQASVIAVASLFGPATVQSVMTGQGAVAVVVSGVQVLSAIASVWGASPEAISTYETDGVAEERSAFIFFALSTVFLLMTTAAHGWMITMPAFKAIVAPFERSKSAVLASEGRSHEREGLVSGGQSSIVDAKSQVFRVAKANITYEMAVSYVFVVTLAVYPPITASILPTNPSTHPLLFSAIHFLVFNIGDFLGRYICSFPRLIIWSARRLLTLSLARTLFIPVFLMCNVQRSATAISSPVISSDILFLMILGAFGLSNGYLSSLCMMSAPSLEHNPRLKGRREDVDIAATVASFFLVGGLAIGSIASFAVRSAVCGCNPFKE